MTRIFAIDFRDYSLASNPKYFFPEGRYSFLSYLLAKCNQYSELLSLIIQHSPALFTQPHEKLIAEICLRKWQWRSIIVWHLSRKQCQEIVQIWKLKQFRIEFERFWKFWQQQNGILRCWNRVLLVWLAFMTLLLWVSGSKFSDWGCKIVKEYQI